jgi:hypothetical protein
MKEMIKSAGASAKKAIPSSQDFVGTFGIKSVVVGRKTEPYDYDT